MTAGNRAGGEIVIGGYDHNFVLRGEIGVLHEAGRVSAPDTGITMTVQTTLPGVQFYSGNSMVGMPEGKGGAAYERRGGLCLETQFYPNAMRCENFRKPILKAGKTYHHQTLYAFTNR